MTWEHVRNAGTFRDAINRFDAFASEHLTSSNYDFVFVTLDAWDLRVQLPREARDKAVVLPLPPALSHFRPPDRIPAMAAAPPRVPSFGPSSLQNICAALEVEAVQTSAPIKHNLPFHLQALAPASPRRAMEEAVTLTRVLRGLIRKSQPPHEHPDVLTRPMDARADVRAFLSERSKVLHMSGLPHDTTQSELESWFTQFGGRPIAFGPCGPRNSISLRNRLRRIFFSRGGMRLSFVSIVAFSEFGAFPLLRCYFFPPEGEERYIIMLSC